MRLATAEEPVYTLHQDLEQAFVSHHAQMLRTAWRITGNATDAEDVLQTVFLRLLGRDDSAPPLENVPGYLHRAAVNAALDVVRARRETLPLESAPPAPPRAAPPVPGELQDCLRRSLATLAPQSAEVFVLRFIEGQSNGEIARMLGISQVRVAVTLHRARKKLQKEIAHYRGGRP
ncbi:MAG: RNA polymerase sigma factor [Terriglobia bacterium]